ncbi:MAG: hypothetical protein HWN65_24130, partial [Candidatus Helarchaeota archaeon]|nr:hypothetical protein [Candidatus Helarchaeota archaeon]
MIKISGELDDDDGEYGEDYDSNDVDPENDPEISNDNDQDNDPDNISESGEEYNPFECPDYDNPDPEYNPFECPDYDNPDQEYNPFKCPDYDNPDQEYNPFKCPDYDNEGKSNPSSPDTEGDEMDQIPRPFEKPVDEDEEEIEKEHGGDYAGVRQENSEKKDLEEIHEDLIREEENVDEPIEENSETEINQEAGNRAELDSKTPDHDSEMNSNIEITNINQEQSTTTIQQESLEQDKEHVEETQEEEPKSIERDPERIPIYNVEEFEISPDYEEIKKETQEEAREGIAEQEEENLQEQYQEQEEHVSQKSFERDKEGKIILDAEQMELFGGRVSSKEEMEVEILEEEMEELFDSYEERGVEQEQRLGISYEIG